jgi:hypothetical protein
VDSRKRGYQLSATGSRIREKEDPRNARPRQGFADKLYLLSASSLYTSYIHKEVIYTTTGAKQKVGRLAKGNSRERGLLARSLGWFSRERKSDLARTGKLVI